jgi:hypothetical protein
MQFHEYCFEKNDIYIPKKDLEILKKKDFHFDLL